MHSLSSLSLQVQVADVRVDLLEKLAIINYSNATAQSEQLTITESTVSLNELLSLS